MTTPISPTVGRIVRYVLPHDSARAGEARAGVITRVWNPMTAAIRPGMSNLRLMLDGPNDFQEPEWRGSVEYDPNGRPGTWHWPTDPAARAG